MLGPLTTQFVMEQIVSPYDNIYREESVFVQSSTLAVPNWFLFVRTKNCHYCDVLIPLVDALARFFHASESKFNYIVGYIDCSTQDSVVLCEYFRINTLPKFLVLRPETGDRFF